MDELVNKSLARKNEPSLSESGCDQEVSYSVHNLQLTYLQEQTTDIVALHRKLVDRYKTVCEGGNEIFPIRGYKHIRCISKETSYILDIIYKTIN